LLSNSWRFWQPQSLVLVKPSLFATLATVSPRPLEFEIGLNGFITLLAKKIPRGPFDPLGTNIKMFLANANYTVRSPWITPQSSGRRIPAPAMMELTVK